jgi:hypothetical protein
MNRCFLGNAVKSPCNTEIEHEAAAMGAIKEPATRQLYEQDFAAWAFEQADAVARRDWARLDIPNLVEELESMGRQQRAELANRLIVLLTHLAKWQSQVEARARHGRSWRLSVAEQRLRVARHLKQTPSLEPLVDEALNEAWEVARIVAARETKLPLESFATECPFSWNDVTREDWMPA